MPDTVPFGNEIECYGVHFSPDSSALYVNNRFKSSSSITRWDTATWKQTARFHHDQRGGYCVVHPNGKAVYFVGGDASVIALNPSTLQKQAQFAHGFAGCLTVSPDGRTLAMFHDLNLTLWDTEKNERILTVREPYREFAFSSDRVSDLLFSPDGRLLLATSEHEARACLIDVVTGRRLADWRTEPGRTPAAFDPSSRYIAIGGSRRTVVVELAGQREHQTFAVQSYPVASANLSHDGNILGVVATVEPNGRHPVFPHLWNLNAVGCPLPFWVGDRFGGDWPHSSFSFTPDGDYFAALRDGEMRVFNHLGRIEQKLIQPLPELHYGLLAPDGRAWMVGADSVYAGRLPLERDKYIRWRNPTGKLTGLAGMASIDVSRNWVVVGGDDGTLRLFSTVVTDDTKELKPVNLYALESHLSLKAVAISPDESQALIGSFTGRCHLISIPGDTSVTSWDAHKSTVTAVLFLSPRILVTGSRDRTVSFWSWDGKEVRELWTIRMAAAVTSFGKSGDGRKLSITCDGERGVHVWDMVALCRRFEEIGIGIETPKSWSVSRLPTPESAPTLPDQSAWPANGLRMELFADTELQSLRLVQHDLAVNWNWGLGQPHPHVPLMFSAR
jgi:WD40 repeat protein